ncbi:MAG: methyl-accepting chemotaxis protein [Bdellovibrionota bacterium]|nr:methyl-accepting chemotaxis protein [Bdellovibrionota bacterium]
MTFKGKILSSLALVGVLSTGISIVVSAVQIRKKGEQDLVEKSRAILSRVHVGSNYVAEMNVLNSTIKEAVEKFPDGNLTDEFKLKILKAVPIYAAFKIGQEGAAKENYEFRIASPQPRNSKNKATPDEMKVINEFIEHPDKKEVISFDEDRNVILISVPSKISESRNCLTCHGHPSTSPFGNGKDVLGYQMEDFKEGDVRATFSVISSLNPVDAEIRSTVMTISFYGFLATLLAIAIAFLRIKKPMEDIQNVAMAIDSASSNLGEQADALSKDSKSIADAVNHQSSSVEQVSASITEITSMISSTVAESENSVKLAKDISEFSNSSQQAMGELQGSVNEIAESYKSIEQLVELIEKIREKTDLIDDIVFKTTLLSFNASIEAARAGEHGRGFAVVAQEVGNLAQMSGKSATEISNIVNEVIETAKRVATENGTKTDASLVHLENTSEHLNKIGTISEAISDSANNVLSATNEQNLGLRQITEGMNLINESTSINAKTADNTLLNSTKLNNGSQNLQEVASKLNQILQGKLDELSTKKDNHSKVLNLASEAKAASKFELKFDDEGDFDADDDSFTSAG